jgi:Anti-sigma factor NepR
MTGEHSSNEGPHTNVASAPRLSSEVRILLGLRLRAVYASLVCEPVPERFLKLLERLEATEKAS